MIHWQVARDQSLALDTVDNRILHISLPVDLNGTTRQALQPEDLAPAFTKKPAILITAEGGAGKTSWACQIARWGLDKKLTQHRLIPRLIEKDSGGRGFPVERTLRGRLWHLDGPK
jgi:hypothetical protein